MDDDTTIPAYSVSDARRALESFAQGSKRAQRGIAHALDIRSFEAIGSYEVSVETFTEQRSLAWQHVPSDEALPEGPKRGGMHNRWSVPVPQPEPFTTRTVRVPVPRSATYVTCPTCDGRRRTLRCPDCGGTGRRPCAACAERPADEQARCRACGGRGSRKCACDRADGRQACPACHATGMLHRYLELTVTWANHVATDTVVQGDPPRDLVESDQARRILYQEEDRRLYARQPGPPTLTGGTRVNEAVHAAVNELLGSADPPAARVHRQRILVRGVPVYQGRYDWKGDTRTFWILGKGERVLAPDYPVSTTRTLALAAVVIAAVTLVIGLLGGFVYRSEIEGVLGMGT